MSRPLDALLSSQSDEQLARLAGEGNEQAFAAIVERYRRELHIFAGRMRTDGRADDLVQQTFLSAFTALRAGTEVQHLRGWLYRILRNEVIRTSSRRVVEVELDPGVVASESMEEVAQRRMVAFEALSSIAALPARQRHVLVASALNGESRAAVAGSMGLTEGAVRQLMHRARATLRAAAAAITPAPLANWMAALRDGPAGGQAPEIAIGAGIGPAAGVALKLGAIIASGAVATGVVGSQLQPRAKHRPPVVRVHSSAAVASVPQNTHISGAAPHPTRAVVATGGVIHPRIGSVRGPTDRGHARSGDDHRGPVRHESHEAGSGGRGPAPAGRRRATGGRRRAVTAARLRRAQAPATAAPSRVAAPAQVVSPARV